jgi:hypothetical protein
MEDQISRRGPPHIKVAPLQIWIHGRACPDRHDYWDGNSLNVTAHCGEQGADVRVSGTLIYLFEIQQWHDALVQMNKIVSGQAKLCGDLEPNLAVDMTIDRLGHISGEVRITPDQMMQRHLFRFELDQTYLGPLIAQCRAVFDEYPIRGRAAG